MKIEKLVSNENDLDNPRYKESKKFKKGGFFATNKTVDFLPGKKKNGQMIGAYKNKKEVEFFEDD